MTKALPHSGSYESDGLIPLTPEYFEQEHGAYVKAIEEALANPAIRNIALSGGYGVGKSSILREVARKLGGRVVELSMSTLAPLEASSLDDSVPKQATTPTNRIQQEIVKQLLYREDPRKTQGSRFRRIERFARRRELAFATLMGFVTALIFLLTGWTQRIGAELHLLSVLGVWLHLFILILSVATTFAVRLLCYGRIHIRQLSAGSATVTLDDKSVTYFDQYLDEIVYFFEVSKRDIVIFEDIDRFNESHIFETLRSLNTLLNVSPHIDKRRPIRFIYATKDSIFAPGGLERERRDDEQAHTADCDPAYIETLRANRTKFFDVVIPVVPFITHSSARNLATQLLRGIRHNIHPDLIDLAARYVPDMRLLTNVRNEFIVFRERLYSGEGKHLELSETCLFAMMLYKSTHLTDFEAIRFGNSSLDQLYDVGRQLVIANVKRLDQELRAARQRLTKLEGAVFRSRQLGDKVVAYSDRLFGHHAWDSRYKSFAHAGADISVEALHTATFWKAFIAPVDEQNLTVTYTRDNQRLSFSRTSLAEALGESLEIEDWDDSVRAELEAVINKHYADLRFLRSADIGDLIRRPDLLVGYNGKEQPLDAVARALLTQGLAFQLLRSNYIDRNFTLYTATFHGDRVSPAAMTFIIHHIDRDVMDEYFALSASDVEAVIRERGKDALSDRALYNISILDHLLGTSDTHADIMIYSLTPLGGDQRRFMQAYLGSPGTHQHTAFVARFATMSPQVLVYLTSGVALDDDTRLTLVSAALGSLMPGVTYLVDAPLSTYLHTHYAALPVLNSSAATIDAAAPLVAVFTDADVRVSSLAPLSDSVRRAFIANNLYAINRENLVIAFENDSMLALDVARDLDMAIYSYILGHLGAYLTAIPETSATVYRGEHFIPVIMDVLREDDAHLHDVIARASADCSVVDIADILEGAWPSLAAHKRFPPTFGNVSHYISEIGSLDDNLASLLAYNGALTEHETVDEGDKAALALTILSARSELPAPPLRAALVKSLTLSDFLDVEKIEAESGELFALLLQDGVIEDKGASYAHLLETDWATRELFIHHSEHFKDYMTPALVQEDVARILASESIDEKIKCAIADRADELARGSSREGFMELARFAVEKGRLLSLETVERLASNGVQSQHVIALLAPHLMASGLDRLIAILNSLDSDYPQLTSVGWDKPTIPNTRADRALLETLKQHGIVNRFVAAGGQLKVHKKRK